MPLRTVDFKLYLITDRRLFKKDEDLIRAADDALSAGVSAIQLREKDLSTRDLLDMAYRFKEMTGRHKAKLFINDRLDIAMAVGADGVHLGQSSIPVGAVRKVVGDNLMIGCSTHSLKEAMDAQQEGADFITFGPLFNTPSKLRYGPPVGLEALREVGKKVRIPILGLGGIKSDNINDVLDSGASGIALISGILSASDRKSAAGEYLEKAGGCK